MNAATQHVPRGTGAGAAQTGGALIGASIAALLGVGLAWALYRYPPTTQVVLAGSLGLGGMLALAVARYEVAVALGFLLLGRRARRAGAARTGSSRW